MASLSRSSAPKQTIIEHDVWIVEDVIIKDGVRTGIGAIVGAGSVVTKNIGAYEIYAGNPARFIGKRFNDDLIQDLLGSEWWLMPEEELKRIGHLMNNPTEFLKSIKK